LKVRPSQPVLIFSTFALLASALVVSSAAAQSKTGERVMIPTLQSADKELGVQAAEAIRNRLQNETNVRELVVVPKADINNSLQSSGYSTTEALAPGDAKALANLVRAAQYMDGTVARTPTGFKIDARLVISRDLTRAQVLPSAQSAKLDDAATQVAKAIKSARRQLPGEEACHNAVSQGKYQEGVTAARGAMQGYPNANIAAVCLAEAYAGLKMNDSVIAVAERVRANDPRNIMALRMLADIYQTNKDPRGIEVLMSLVAADPTNLRIQQAVVNELAQSGQAERAIPIVRDLLQNNPGDPQLLSLGWLVYLAAKDYEGAINVGNELVRVDTAAATADYFTRLAGAYTNLNQPQKAAEALARGTAKFPNNARLILFSSQALLKAGQTQQAIDAAKRALAIDPKVENGYLQLVQAVSALNQPDQVMTALQTAVANGGDKSVLSKVALQQGSNAYKAGQGSKNRADFQLAIKFLQLSDQLESSADAKFLLGASAFSLGQSATIDANERKSCDLARIARDAFTLAQANLPAGGQKYPTEAAQLLTAIPQFTPAVENEIKRFCK
jgi:Putative Zn-dependent protease, contains TPR repeats